MNQNKIIDIFIIGGGINGSGIARDAAGRGLSVMMCEKDDLGQGASSKSGKLIHGGLRYLEYYEFRLVHKALIEREVLLNSACHIIRPMRFVLPNSPNNRPAWLIRLGLFLYDNLGGRKKLPGTRTLNLHRDPEGEPILNKFKRGFEYSDCWVDDARLVTLNAIDASEKGAEILTRTECVSAERKDGCWFIKIRNKKTGATQTVNSRTLVNAGGPWVNKIIKDVTKSNSKLNIRLVKGSHIIVNKFWQGMQSYLIQNDDKRVIFINSYEGDKALIGTTDIPYDGVLEDVSADEFEIEYLINSVNKFFKEKLRRSDVLQSFSGVRPLFDDGKGDPSSVTRDYIFDLDESNGVPLLNIFGGKITTFRKLSEHALEKLGKFLPHMQADWTKDAVLPGGDIDGADFVSLIEYLRCQYDWLPRSLILHYAQLYGTRTKNIIVNARSLDDLGKFFGSNLYYAEVKYLIENEWAMTAEDILERRTKEGLHLSLKENQSFNKWFDEKYANNLKIWL